MPALTRKTWWIIGALTIFTVTLVVGTDISLKRIPSAAERSGGNVLPGPSGKPAEKPVNGAAHFIERNVPDPRAVIYTDAGFSTRSITIRASDPIGCAMTIRNETAKSVTIRVGPHNPNGEDPGFPYQPIAPKETSVFDVRYAGLSAITIHDHARPQFELTINYGEGCR